MPKTHERSSGVPERSSVTKIILDTNFLLIPAQFGVDIFSEIKRICDFPYELCIIGGTIEELKSIQQDSEQKGKNKRAAKMGLQLLKMQKHRVIDVEAQTVDYAIIDYCTNHENCIVATQDIALRKKLKELRPKMKFITLRSRKFLKVE